MCLNRVVSGIILLTFLSILIPFPREVRAEGTSVIEAVNPCKSGSIPSGHSAPFHHCARCCMAHHHDITHRAQFFMPFFGNSSYDFFIPLDLLPDILLINPIYHPPRI